MSSKQSVGRVCRVPYYLINLHKCLRQKNLHSWDIVATTMVFDHSIPQHGISNNGQLGKHLTIYDQAHKGQSSSIFHSPSTLIHVGLWNFRARILPVIRIRFQRKTNKKAYNSIVMAVVTRRGARTHLLYSMWQRKRGTRSADCDVACALIDYYYNCLCHSTRALQCTAFAIICKMVDAASISLLSWWHWKMYFFFVKYTILCGSQRIFVED